MRPPLAPYPVRALWPEQSGNDSWSRSLWFERFADPSLKDRKDSTPRRDFFEHGFRLKPLYQKPGAWLRFLRSDLRLPWSNLLFAQLQARLLVNAGGGVMENAGLALDRFSGQPFIPGSAVKGCARRNAVEHLGERRVELFPGAGHAAHAHDEVALGELTGEVVLFLKTFGWADTDWLVRGSLTAERWQEKRSDVAFACDELWEPVREKAAAELATWLGAKTDSQKPFWKAVPNFAGMARFLPAYPVQVTLSEQYLPVHLGKLELDLLAAHHRKYHEGDPEYADAPDTEDPNIVFFPAVAAGHVFVFTVTAKAEDLAGYARALLKQGLERFGLGAKTGAGYGWFLDVSELASESLARQEELVPWRRRVARFAELPDAEKEREALDFVANGIWQRIKGESGAKAMGKFLSKREAVLSEPWLPWLLKASAFEKLSPAAQEESALELSDHTDVLGQSQTHFPHSLAAAIAYLQTSGLWSREP